MSFTFRLVDNIVFLFYSAMQLWIFLCMLNKKPRIPTAVSIPEQLSYKAFATFWLHKPSALIREMPIYLI